MITQTYLTKNPAKVYQPYVHQPFYSEKEINGARARKITPAEFVRRDKIVRDLWIKTDVNIGDVCYPVAAKAYEESGACVVTGLCRSLSDFGPDDKWPKNDNPMIVSFHSVDKPDKVFVCTYDYLTKENRHLSIC